MDNNQQPSSQPGSKQQPSPPQKNPVFEPRPGWGGIVKKNFRGIVLPIIVIIVAVVLLATLPKRQKSEDSMQSPTPSTGMSGTIETDQGGMAMLNQTAQKGDSVTTLARHAIKDYVSIHPELVLTPEQKIYIEDYLKDRIGPRSIRTGEMLSFNEKDIVAGAEKAKGLTPGQLKNLSQYVARVAEFREEEIPMMQQ